MLKQKIAKILILKEIFPYLTITYPKCRILLIRHIVKIGMHDPRNPHSGNVMKKCGMTYHMIGDAQKPGNIKDAVTQGFETAKEL